MDTAVALTLFEITGKLIPHGKKDLLHQLISYPKLTNRPKVCKSCFVLVG